MAFVTLEENTGQMLGVVRLKKELDEQTAEFAIRYAPVSRVTLEMSFGSPDLTSTGGSTARVRDVLQKLPGFPVQQRARRGLRCWRKEPPIKCMPSMTCPIRRMQSSV